MKKLKLISLRFKNFKGFKQYDLVVKGNNTDIAGDNGTGKTSIFDGVTWLFFGKDSSGKSDFQLKPTDTIGNEKHNLEIEVEAIISIDDKETNLKRRFKEIYTKKHGTATKEFTGHTTDYFIDEVPVKKKEYEDFISGIIEEKLFKLITNPFEFNNLHWKERREILIDICGGLSDKEIIDSDKKLAGLSKILGKCSIDDHKKKIASKKRDINKELEVIPARIDEVKLSIKEVDKCDPAEKEKALIKLSGHEEDLRVLKSNEAISQKRVQINELKNDILKIKSKDYDQKEEKLNPVRNQINKLKDQKTNIERQVADINFSITQDEERNRHTEAALKKLKEQFYAEQEKEVDIKTQCPACGQDLPEDEIDEATEKFNQAKAEALKNNNAEGKALKQSFEERQKSIEDAKLKLINLIQELSEIESAIKDKTADFELINNNTEPVNTKALENQKEALENEIKELEGGTEKQQAEVKTQIEAVKTIIAEYDKLEAEFEASVKARERIKALEEQEATLAAQFENLESELFLIDQFIIKKVGLLENKINSKFKLARFKMFNTQINGGIEECCETLYNGVPYNSGLNSAMRINVGLDIINTLSEHYEFSSPIFIDNNESVNELIKTKAQLITLTVTKDKELKIS